MSVWGSECRLSASERPNTVDFEATSRCSRIPEMTNVRRKSHACLPVLSSTLCRGTGSGSGLHD